jgi:1,4-dihydroxy-6-naphthoate synthase
MSENTLHFSLGFSSCPNDTFIFDAMVHNKIDTEGLSFEVIMEDVEKLNHRVMAGLIDISKLSYHAYAYMTYTYSLLDAGSALGKGCGPLLISLKPYGSDKNVLDDLSVAIPGKFTTANFLLSLYAPGMKRKKEMLFSDIEGAVLKGEVDTGLIIHENRFTYAAKGLLKIVDLGEYWENLSGLPIPLGGIAVNNKVPKDIRQKINRVLRRSVEYAFANPEASSEYVRAHAREMNEDVMRQHIKLYVNNFSISLGEEGRNAVLTLFQKARDLGLIDEFNVDMFV